MPPVTAPRVIVPLLSPQLALVKIVIMATGGVGTVLTVTDVGADTQVIFVEDLTAILCNPDGTAVNVTDAWKAPPSRLYSNPAPSGADTTMIPVGAVQVGCTVTLAVGAAGAAGTGLTVNEFNVDTHPVAVC